METGFITLKNDSEKFLDYWHKYADINHVSPLYLTTNFQYLRDYSAPLFADESFIYLHAGHVVACAFVPIEDREKNRSISSAGGFVPAPHFKPEPKIEKIVMSRLDEIAKNNQVEKIMLRIDPLENNLYPYNYLMNYDYLDASLLGYFINTNAFSIRRNHRRAVKKIESDQTISLFVMDKNNNDFDLHEKYRELHHLCSGRITRPLSTFNFQYQMLLEGNAVLVGLIKDTQLIASTYFTFNHRKALSYSAADHPDWSHLPLYHIINAKAVEYLGQHGVDEIDLGQPLNTSNQLFHFPDQKQKNISLFKTGFTGHFVENFRGVKYFSQTAFKNDLDKFTETYQQKINANF